MDLFRCYKCREEKPRNEFSGSGGRKPSECKICKNKRTIEYQRRYRAAHPEKVKADRQKRSIKNREYQRELYKKLKKEVILAYGGECVCCGEANICFLTIDHIFNDGNIERSKANKNTGVQIYRYLKKHGFPKGRFQILCANCNFSKQHDPAGHRKAHPNAIKIDGGESNFITRGKTKRKIQIVGFEEKSQ